jgi:hypothetical protein
MAIRWPIYVSCVEEVRNVNRHLIGEHMERDHLRNLVVDQRIIRKRVLNKYDMGLDSSE